MIIHASAGIPIGGAISGPRVELQTSAAAESIAVPAALLSSALRNLLFNALRQSPEPGSVALRIEPQPGRVTLCADDGGTGIGAAERAQATQRFWRPGSSSVAGDVGSGLALSTVDSIVRGAMAAGCTGSSTRPRAWGHGYASRRAVSVDAKFRGREVACCEDRRRLGRFDSAQVIERSTRASRSLTVPTAGRATPETTS